MMTSEGTVGGLDEKEVQLVIQRAWPDVNRCIRKGRATLPMLGGDVGIDITVGTTGKASEVFIHTSTLGHHEVEACIIEAFRKPQWPRPIGGKVGKVGQTFSFASSHAEPPLSWSADVLEQGMKKEADDGEDPFSDLIATLEGCKDDAGTGPFRVTMYLDEDGFVQAAGMGMSDALGVGAVECVVQTMKTTSFPAPEENYAKVTVDVK